jgi:serine/threonine protein kinase
MFSCSCSASSPTFSTTRPEASTPGSRRYSSTSTAPAEPAGGAPDLSFLAAPQQPDELGRLGSYRVLKVLGKGGMGLVLLAEDVELARPVALKVMLQVMLPRAAKNPSARQRFVQEARAAAKLRDDHIVTIFQVSEDHGVRFLAMELLDGVSLDDVLASGLPLDMPEILRIGREIAQGLAAAHEKGLIHRDIKPANLWLDQAHGGRIKILDFGLARLEGADIHLTQSGAIVGTPAYMAPEQGRGERMRAPCPTSPSARTSASWT